MLLGLELTMGFSNMEIMGDLAEQLMWVEGVNTQPWKGLRDSERMQMVNSYNHRSWDVFL